MDEERKYGDWLRQAVGSAAAQGVSSVPGFVARCEGADPLVVWQTLSDLGVITHNHEQPETELAVNNADSPVEASLPVPHPLDFDWRYSREGAALILDEAAALGAGKLLLLGSTTIAIAAARASWRGAILAIDQSQPVVQGAQTLGLAAQFVAADVTTARLVASTADLVVIDPPWYPEYLRCFLWAAVQSCKTGGYVIVSLPGRGTRPGVARDVAELLMLAETTGLRLSHVRRGAVSYETPLFERNAFLAAGMNDDFRYWRRADLWVLQRTEGSPGSRPIPVVSPEPWGEVCIGRMRVRFRSDRNNGDPSLVSIVPGDVLPSVSRRDPRRQGARIWTSGNRIFDCGHPVLLCNALRALGAGRDPVGAAARALGRPLTFSERATLLSAALSLTELSKKESHEENDIDTHFRWDSNVVS